MVDKIRYHAPYKIYSVTQTPTTKVEKGTIMEHNASGVTLTLTEGGKAQNHLYNQLENNKDLIGYFEQFMEEPFINMTHLSTPFRSIGFYLSSTPRSMFDFNLYLGNNENDFVWVMDSMPMFGIFMDEATLLGKRDTKITRFHVGVEKYICTTHAEYTIFITMAETHTIEEFHKLNKDHNTLREDLKPSEKYYPWAQYGMGMYGFLPACILKDLKNNDNIPTEDISLAQAMEALDKGLAKISPQPLRNISAMAAIDLLQSHHVDKDFIDKLDSVQGHEDLNNIADDIFKSLMGDLEKAVTESEPTFEDPSSTGQPYVPPCNTTLGDIVPEETKRKIDEMLKESKSPKPSKPLSKQTEDIIYRDDTMEGKG